MYRVRSIRNRFHISHSICDIHRPISDHNIPRIRNLIIHSMDNLQAPVRSTLTSTCLR